MTGAVAVAACVDSWRSRARVRDLEVGLGRVRRAAGHEAEQHSLERDAARALMTITDRAIIVTDRERRVITLNDAAETLFGISSEQAAGRPAIAVVRDYEIERLLRQFIAGQAPAPLSVTMAGRQVQAWGTAVVAADGQVRAGVLLVADISELHHLRTVRRDFVANISHELRTPLATIRLLLETLRNGALEDRAVAEHFLEKMDLETLQLVGLVEQLLELSRIEAGQEILDLRPTALYSLTEAVLGREASLAEQHGVRLYNDVPVALPAAWADREKIGRVILNLVHNAIKFSPAGSPVHVAAAVRDGGLVVSVRDSGAGIAAPDLPRVFERFYRSDRARVRVGGVGTQSSSGLGLAIARHIVEAHGGHIWAESIEGQGATFSFTLPVAAETHNDARPPVRA